GITQHLPYHDTRRSLSSEGSFLLDSGNPIVIKDFSIRHGPLIHHLSAFIGLNYRLVAHANRRRRKFRAIAIAVERNTQRHLLFRDAAFITEIIQVFDSMLDRKSTRLNVS